ncbi:hypothetical protein Tco_0260293 [Tanacetum coccineum]
MIQSSITKSLENVILAKSSSQPKSTYEAAASLTEFELKNILLDKIQKSKSYRGTQEHKYLYDALVKSYKLDKDLFESYGKVYSLKRDREDKDKDEDPPFGSDQGLKKWKTSKDAKLSRGSKSKESKSSSSKGSKSQSKSSGKSAQAEEPIENLTQEYLVGPVFNLIKGTCKSQVELEYHFEECYKAVTDRLDWTNPKGHEYPFDLRKPLTLIEDQGRQVVPTNYFINNDLEYLKCGSLSRKYTTSATKTKAAKYDTIEGIEDMLYKFKEGDFPRLNLCDIEDMLLLLVQKKLSNLERDILIYLIVALQMFTRRVVILKRVEDLQLGVESYQKKLNITKPKTFSFDITNMAPYNAYNNPQGIKYLDKFQRNRKRSCIMVKAIDQQLFERRLMRNLEKFVGGREYGEDFRLLEQTMYRYSFPQSSQNRRDLPRDIPLVRIEVLRKIVTYRFTLTVLSALRRFDSNLDSDPLGDDLPGEDLTETAKSLLTQTALTLVVHPPPPSLLPSSSSLPPSLFPSYSSLTTYTFPSSLESNLRSPSPLPTPARPAARLTSLRARDVASLGAAQMDIRDLIESHRTDRLKMRVVSAIETIAIYEVKTRMTHDSRNQVERQEYKVREDASNKRKWEAFWEHLDEKYIIWTQFGKKHDKNATLQDFDQALCFTVCGDGVSHDLFPSFGEFPSVDELEPQPLPNLPFLDVNLGDKRGTDPPI